MSLFRHRKAPLVPMQETLAMCDVNRARRLDPPVRLDRMPENEARRIWSGRVLRKADAK